MSLLSTKNLFNTCFSTNNLAGVEASSELARYAKHNKTNVPMNGNEFMMYRWSTI